MTALVAPKGIDPTPSDVGRMVIYRTAPNFEAENGVITSYNDTCVFVRYCGLSQSQPTSRCDLDFFGGSK